MVREHDTVQISTFYHIMLQTHLIIQRQRIITQNYRLNTTVHFLCGVSWTRTRKWSYCNQLFFFLEQQMCLIKPYNFPTSSFNSWDDKDIKCTQTKGYLSAKCLTKQTGIKEIWGLLTRMHGRILCTVRIWCLFQL